MWYGASSSNIKKVNAGCSSKQCMDQNRTVDDSETNGSCNEEGALCFFFNVFGNDTTLSETKGIHYGLG